MNTSLLAHFKEVREQTENICNPLEIEDYSVQPIIDVSPPKWHLAHSTWFFEQFILVPHSENYKVHNADFAYLFNSYYNNAGDRVLRPNRGLMTRPTVKQVYDYRKYVTEHLAQLLEKNVKQDVLNLVEIGINHEQQHQELLAYDIKYILGHQPTFPSYAKAFQLKEETIKQEFLSVEEGVYTIGHQNNSFCFDNELGVHKTYIQPFKISNKLVTNAEYIEFIEAGGYTNFNLWHAEGWDFINKNTITTPLYWYKIDENWQYYNLNGLETIDPNLPVTHISYYEAFAYAQWKGMRLPTEFEWEVAADKFKWGQVWEWTASAYQPYPNFKKAEGALGEYNGKFMVNLQVLRGASVATAKNHSRKTYRNFFHASLQWMFSGIRLVE
ncbi:ergothioneine biosynthesis protein EgtB [Lacinutrix salivirga]